MVSDTSLITIRRIALLRELFSTVHIPPAVQRELLAYHVDLPPFVHVTPINGESRTATFGQGLDAGEVEAIVLATELRPVA